MIIFFSDKLNSVDSIRFVEMADQFLIAEKSSDSSSHDEQNLLSLSLGEL